MTTPRQVLLSQLSACRDTNGWFVSMKSAVAGLPAAQASARTDAHSIHQVVFHAAYWSERYLARWRGQALPDVPSNDASFDTGDRDWPAVVQWFDAVMAAWKSEIEAAPEERLEAPLRPGASETWYGALSHMVLHTAHHVGQVVTLRKLQGSWDPKQGVS